MRCNVIDNALSIVCFVEEYVKSKSLELCQEMFEIICPGVISVPNKSYIYRCQKVKENKMFRNHKT